MRLTALFQNRSAPPPDENPGDGPAAGPGTLHAALNDGQRKNLRELALRAAGSLWRSWPIRTFVYRNPLQGFEHLPFDEAVRQARKLLGVEGYLSVTAYRELYRSGRITEEAVRAALEQVRPLPAPLSLAGRAIDSIEVLRVHLLWGLEGLDPDIFEWKVLNEDILRCYRPEVPSEKRLYAEGGPLNTLWERILGRMNPAGPVPGSPGELENPQGRLLSDLARIGRRRTAAEWIDGLTGTDLVQTLNREMIRWLSAFLDEGLSAYEMPFRKKGFYAAWRELVSEDYTGWFLGIRDFPGKVRRLPPVPEDALALCLDRLGIPEASRENILRRHLAQLPGWAGLIKWRAAEPDYALQGRHPIDLVSYLAVRLFYECELADLACRERWKIRGNISDIRNYFRRNPEAYRPREQVVRRPEHCDHVSGETWRFFQLAQFLGLSVEDMDQAAPGEIRAVLDLLDLFPAGAHGPVWLFALEHSYREELLSQLSREPRAGETAVRPAAQALFCIDARSEGLRRHLEDQGHPGSYETFGIAGFFGVPLCFRPYGAEEDSLLCPALIKPERRAAEVPRPDDREAARRYEARGAWAAAGHDLFHDLKANNLSAFPVIDFLSPAFGLRLIGKSLFPALDDRWGKRASGMLPPPPGTQIRLDRPEASKGGTDLSGRDPFPFGFTPEEQCGLVENALRMVGLTGGFARLVFFCGHGSRTANNPFAAAYDCGACGGRHGGPNARALTKMANRPEVREGLNRRGIGIPEDTVFIAGEHNTATDEVELFDREDIPASHEADVAALLRDLDRAGRQQARERLGRIPGTPKVLSPAGARAHARRRSGDWAEIRPEWGLARNAAFVIGRRSLTRGVNLKGRVFLNSYDPGQDESGKALETILTGPLVVVQTICMEYYFSSTDPWTYGSGSKVLHNVTAGVGVMLGRQGDLAAGLPIQSVAHGRMIYHEPMRPLVVIEAPGQRVRDIIARHAVLRNFTKNEWIRLLVLEPSSHTFFEYRSDGSLEPVPSRTGEARRGS